MNKPQKQQQKQGKKPRTAITPTREEDFAEWYQQVVKATDMAETSPTRGCMIIKPYGWAIWEKCQEIFDKWLTQNNVSVREVMVMESTETLSSMVAHNLGISIVPNLCMPDPTFASLRKLPLGPTTIPRVLGILTRSDCSKIHLVNRLQEQIEKTLK